MKTTARKWAGKPSNIQTKFVKSADGFKEIKGLPKSLTNLEIKQLHQKNHPNDKNIKNPNKGIYWGKRGFQDDLLDEFYETHVYTFIDANLNKGWVSIGGEEE